MTCGPAKRTLIKLPWLLRSLHKSGAIAQLGERIVRNDEVVGSSPTSSTKFLENGDTLSFMGVFPGTGTAH